MNKKILFVLIIFVMFFGIINITEAKNAKNYKRGDNTFTIDKDKAVVNEEFGIVQIYLGEVTFSIAEAMFDDSTPVYFYTTTEDLAYREKDLWWNTVYYCFAADLGFGTLGANEVAAVYTDSMASQIGDSDSFLGLFGNEESCSTYKVTNVSEKNRVSFCEAYSTFSSQINELVQKYKKTPKAVYKKDYNEKVDYLKSKCKGSFVSADWNDACVERCRFLEEDIAFWNQTMDPSANETNCGFSARLLFWVRNILNWIKFILPVIVIVFGILDFIKAMSGDKDDEMKKAQGRFIKRLIAAALAFIVPLIIVFVLDKMGFGDYIQGCGVIDV